MSNICESAQRAFDVLWRGANERRRRYLIIVDAACWDVRKDSTQSFSVASVARCSSARGGPGIKAMYNAGGNVYRTLIAAHRAELIASPSAVGCRVSPWAHLDRDARARIHLLETQLRQTRRALAETRGALRGADPKNVGRVMEDEALP